MIKLLGPRAPWNVRERARAATPPKQIAGRAKRMYRGAPTNARAGTCTENHCQTLDAGTWSCRTSPPGAAAPTAPPGLPAAA
eukprot:6268710-Pyramimonas_sp.AAC.1